NYFLRTVLWLESLARLKVERDDVVRSKHLAANGCYFANAKKITDLQIVVLLFFVATRPGAFLLLIFFLAALEHIFDFLLDAFIFLLTIGNRKVFAVQAHQPLDEIPGNRRYF